MYTNYIIIVLTISHSNWCRGGLKEIFLLVIAICLFETILVVFRVRVHNVFVRAGESTGGVAAGAEPTTMPDRIFL